MWDWIAFVVGFLIGLVFMILLTWILYVTRSYIYSNCPDTQRTCRGDDYYADPGVALSNGAVLDEILMINDQEKMYYKRYPRTGTCTPGNNQVVQIQQPEFCTFTLTSGQELVGENQFFGSNIYTVFNGTEVITVKTTNSCRPDSSIPPDLINRGVPLLAWNPV
jgi:hypothetical protein